MNVKKIDEKDLKDLKDLQNKIETSISNLGRLTLSLTLIENDINNEKENVKVLVIEERKLKNSLLQKYGNSDINIQTGEIIPK